MSEKERRKKDQRKDKKAQTMREKSRPAARTGFGEVW